jgi:hypothetical protein
MKKPCLRQHVHYMRPIQKHRVGYRKALESSMSTLIKMPMTSLHETPDSVSSPFFGSNFLVMRQQGTMKVMWNIRLFKGMQLLPRQVSDGDRRMDVYVKMVLVDDGQPKSYAIKVFPFPQTDNLTW